MNLNAKEFGELSEQLQLAVFCAGGLKHGLSLGTPALTLGTIEGLGKGLRAINGAPSAIAPYIERLEAELVNRGQPDAIVGQRRYLSWVEAAISECQRLYLGCFNAANPLAMSGVYLGGELCDIEAIEQNADGVATWLASVDMPDWEEIRSGLRREAIILAAALQGGAGEAPVDDDAADSLDRAGKAFSLTWDLGRSDGKPVGATHLGRKSDDSESAQTDLPKASGREAGKLTMPATKSWQVWHLRAATGTTKQTELAARMTENGVPMTQGEVSRHLKQVNKYLLAGGAAVTVEDVARMVTTDPDRLELGPRFGGERFRPEWQRCREVDE